MAFGGRDRRTAPRSGRAACAGARRSRRRAGARRPRRAGRGRASLAHSRVAGASSTDPSPPSAHASRCVDRSRKSVRQLRPTSSIGRSDCLITSSATLPECRPAQATAPVRRHADDAVVAAVDRVEDRVARRRILRPEDVDRAPPAQRRDLVEVLIGLDRSVVLRRHEQQAAADARRRASRRPAGRAPRTPIRRAGLRGSWVPSPLLSTARARSVARDVGQRVDSDVEGDRGRDTRAVPIAVAVPTDRVRAVGG